MQTIELHIPDEIFISLKETRESMPRSLQMAAALKLFELGKLSSGAAAQLAGMPRVQFLHVAGQYKVEVLGITTEELARDVRNA
jgi:predicted HTH domain antitoxin